MVCVAVSRTTLTTTASIIETNMIPTFTGQHVLLTDPSVAPTTSAVRTAASFNSAKDIIPKTETKVTRQHVFVTKLT